MWILFTPVVIDEGILLSVMSNRWGIGRAMYQAAVRPRRRNRWSSRHTVGVFVLAFIGAIAVLVPLSPAGAATLSNVSSSWSSTATAATAVTYHYDFTVATTGNLTSVTFSVPTGTGGTPALGPVIIMNNGNRTALSGPSVNLVGTTLTLSFSSQYFFAGALWSVDFTGITNSSTAGSFTPSVTTMNNSSSVDTGTSSPIILTATSLTNAFWALSSTLVSSTGVSYTYGFLTGSSSSLSSISMTVPGGTTGTVSLGAVSPATIGGGALSQSGMVITYSFSAVAVPASTAIRLTLNGLTNTSGPRSFGGEVATLTSGVAVNSAALPLMTFTATALTATSWSASSNTTTASGVAYTYDFTTSTTLNNASSITMTVPGGTSGTPAVGTLSVTPSYITLASPSVVLSGGVLTLTFNPIYIPNGAVLSVQITGLTNTTVAGSYTSSITTFMNASNLVPAVDSAVAPAVAFTSSALSSLSWSVSSTAVSATNVTETLSFGLPSSSTLTSISMTVPPGTGGTPTLSSASPPSISGGVSPTLVGTTLTYSFSAASVSSSSTITLVIGGMTNSSTPNVYSSTVTASNGASAVASGTTPTVTFTSTVLTSLSWGASSTTAGATGVSYTFGFTNATGTAISSITLTVPSGTGGTPTVGTVSVYSASAGAYISLVGQAVNLSLTTLTFSFTSIYIPGGSVWSIQLNGLSNTSNAGSYTSSITTKAGSAAVDSGTTPSLSFSSSVLGNPTWSVSSTGIATSNTTYTYGFTVQSAATINTITMTVPAGTSGTPGVGTVTPSALTGGSVSLTSGLLTYTLASATSLSTNASVSIAVTGLTNTATSGAYTSSITMSYQGTAKASGTTPAVTFTATSLTGLSWTVSSAATASTGVTYTYGFTTASSATLNEVTMTVPTGTSGTPGVGTVTPSALGGGSVILSGTTLTYSFSSVYTSSGTAVSISITGLTNPSNPGSSTAVVATKSSGATIDSGTTPSVTFVGGTLGSPTWSATSTASGAGATYTYTFTAASTSSLSSVTMTVPSGTGGTPTVGTVTPSPLSTGASVSIVGSTLSYSFTSTSVAAGTAVSIQINGLVNTTNAGPYSSLITTKNGAASIDTGTSNSLTFLASAPNSLNFTNSCAPGSLSCVTNGAGGTTITLVAIPGATYTTGGVVLSVSTNNAHGYRVRATTSSLSTAGGAVLAQASTSGVGARPVNAFYASASLSPSSSSGAVLCNPYGSSTPYVGYGTSAFSLWNAIAGTGLGSDALTLTNAIQLTIAQPAGVYTGTIAYTVEPAYSGTSSC